MIHVRNIIDKSITMSKYIKLNKIINFDEKKYYYIDNTNTYLTINYYEFNYTLDNLNEK